MNRLYKMLSIRKKIETKRNELSEVCHPAPKAQVLTGMPRGGEARNVAEDYVERKEKLCDEIEALYDKIEKLWDDFERFCDRRGLRSCEICLLKLRFYYNYSWKKVQQKLQVYFPNDEWNKNRVFRVRRHALDKINNNYHRQNIAKNVDKNN